MEGLFLTGATGFIGRRVVAELCAHAVTGVTVLVRTRAKLAGNETLPGDWEVVEGDICERRSYEGALRPGMTVLHLAAATGKSSAEAHHTVNVAGTSTLLEGCVARGTGRFIYVSSIAATFADRRYYPYAEAKLAAESLVRASGLEYVIVRPTMVLGEGSPVLQGLRALAGGPALVQIGPGRVPVQPVHVNDLARLLADMAEAAAGTLPRIVEVGGAEVLELRELLRRVRQHTRGTRGPVVRIPVALLRRTLALLEPLLGGRLPLSAGQLASFVNPGTATAQRFVDERRASFAPLQAMIST